MNLARNHLIVFAFPTPGKYKEWNLGLRGSLEEASHTGPAKYVALFQGCQN